MGSTSVSGRDPRPPRMSTAKFTLGFGALLIVCIVLTVGVLTHELSASETSGSESTSSTAGSSASSGSSGTTETSSSTTSSPPTTVTGSDGSTTVVREPKPTPPETNLDQVNASIQTQFIADAKTARTYTGIAVEGAMTEFALHNPIDFSGHISRLLKENCVDSMALTTPSNTRVTFNGFCYTTLPPQTIQRMLGFGLDGEADSVDFANFPARGNKNHLTLTWYGTSDSRVEKLQESWNELRRPRPIDQVNLYAYTPDEVTRVVKARGYADRKSVDPMLNDD